MLVETQAIDLKLLKGGGSQFAKAWPAPCSQVGDNLQEDVVGSVLSALTGAHILDFHRHARLLAPPKCAAFNPTSTSRHCLANITSECCYKTALGHGTRHAGDCHDWLHDGSPAQAQLCQRETSWRGHSRALATLGLLALSQQQHAMPVYNHKKRQAVHTTTTTKPLTQSTACWSTTSTKPTRAVHEHALDRAATHP